MAYCPNTRLKEWKDLVSAQGKKLAYFLWDKYKGNVPSMFYVNSASNVNTLADVILPIGTSGSGKSTWIKSVNTNNQFVII